MGGYVGGSLDPIDDVELPELIDLPVYREDYISQERVDELCKLVWKERQYDIKTMVFHERDHEGPFDRNCDYFYALKEITNHLREEEKTGRIEPISMIAMVNLNYEISRRVRLATGYEDYKPYGKPIADGPQGPFPPIGQLDNWLNGRRDEDPAKISPDREAVYNKLCKEHPEVVFANAEARQRHIALDETYEFIDAYYRKHLPEKGNQNVDTNNRKIIETHIKIVDKIASCMKSKYWKKYLLFFVVIILIHDAYVFAMDLIRDIISD